MKTLRNLVTSSALLLAFAFSCKTKTDEDRSLLREKALRPNWSDSYSANGQCYCKSNFDHGIDDVRSSRYW